MNIDVCVSATRVNFHLNNVLRQKLSCNSGRAWVTWAWSRSAQLGPALALCHLFAENL